MNKSGAGMVGGATDFLRSDGTFSTFDKAEFTSPTQHKICELLTNCIDRLSEWEKAFLIDIYNQEPLSKKQHIKVYRLYKQKTTVQSVKSVSKK